MKRATPMCRHCFADFRGRCGCIDARDERDARQRAEIRRLRAEVKETLAANQRLVARLVAMDAAALRPAKATR